VLHVPTSQYNLLSLSKWDKSCSNFSVNCGCLSLAKHDGKVIALGQRLRSNLYKMRLHVQHKYTHDSDSPHRNIACSANVPQSWETWHKCFGHISYQGLQELQCRDLVKGLKINVGSAKPDCCACIEAKQSQKSYPHHSAHSTQHAGELMHLDMWGKFPIESIEKMHYFLGLINDHTQYVTIEGLFQKRDATRKVKDYITSLKTHGRNPRAICCDEGSEFLTGDLIDWLKQEGIELQTTATYSPSQNRVAEHMNHTLVELAHMMINVRDLPKFLWELAIKHAAYLQNCAYTCVCTKMPYQAWTREKLDVSHLREFGVPVWILQQGAHKGHKLQLKLQQ
jgi:GAG-pre-integrase domain